MLDREHSRPVVQNRKGLHAYSQDLVIELDHELTDVFPAASDLLYHFVDAKSDMTSEELMTLISGAGLANEEDVQRVLEFLLYYGILGIKTETDSTHYIFDVHYDLKALMIRAKRGGSNLRYVMNPAFAPALSVRLAA